MRAAVPLLAFAIWALGQFNLPTPTRPNAGTPALTAEATRPRRYKARHAATRKRDNA